MVESPASGARRLTADALIIPLLLLYFVAALWMTFRLPAQAAPNEWLNYEYITVMRETGRWPNRGAVDEERRYNEWHQPPVYFTLATALGLPWEAPDADAQFPTHTYWPASPDAALVEDVPPPLGFVPNPFFTATHVGNLNPALHISPASHPTFYAARIAAALFGLLGVAALFWAGRVVHGTPTGLLIASLMAFQPGFLHLSGAINNDAPLTALSAVVLAFGVWLLVGRRSPAAYALWGVLCALAILTKTNGVFLGPAVAVVLLRDWRRFGLPSAFRHSLATGMPVLLLWGGWLWRNIRLTNDTLGLAGSFPVREVLLQNPLNVRFLAPVSGHIFRSFWLDWTAGDVAYAADWVYIVAGLVLAIGLGGWLIRTGRSCSQVDQSDTRWIQAHFLVAAATIAYLYLEVKGSSFIGAGFLVPEGRWVLPLLPSLAWFVGAGLVRIWPRRWRNGAALAMSAFPLLTGFALLHWLLPALYPRAIAVAEPKSVELSIEYGPVTLLSAEAPTFVAGEAGAITSWWTIGDATPVDTIVSTQLLTWSDGDWHKLDEQNSVHGLGLSPSGDWRAGETWQDRVTLLPPPDSVTQPTHAIIAMQLADADGPLPALHGGVPVALPQAAQTAVYPVTPLPVPDTAKLPASISFGGQLELAGLAVDRTQATLYWRSLSAGLDAYTIFVHALDDDGSVVAQSDQPPAAGSSPTTIWRAGDLIRDTHQFDLTLSNASELRIGVYNSESIIRLPAVQNDLRLADDVFYFALNK